MMKLSKREKQLVELLAEGATTEEIGGVLDLTISTVNTYFKRIFSKMGVHSRTQLLVATGHLKKDSVKDLAEKLRKWAYDNKPVNVDELLGLIELLEPK